MFQNIIWLIVWVFFVGVIIFLVSKNSKQTIKMMSSWGIYEAYSFIFDFIFWPILQGLYGFYAVIVLIIIALINNFIILHWYQKKQVDWFGVDVFKDVKTNGHIWINNIGNTTSIIRKISYYIPLKILKFIIWLLRSNDVFAFVTLSVWQDSFITTIFLRHNSTILSCLAWSVLMQIIIVVFKALFKLF